ncbi:hypothetical protein LR004_00120 [Candidatus Gracilibacteria bacterium]|nr:hypothetical protein [Candidatus Gracilibacteria bacterium]
MFSRIFQYSLKNIFRNTFLSISSILVLTLLMFFINILLVMHNISFKLIEGVNEKLTISLYLKDGYDKNSVEVIGLIESIRGLGGSTEVFYKDKDDVLEEVRKKDPELVNIIERHNPLPETIELSNIAIEDYKKVDYLIQQKFYLLSEGPDTGTGATLEEEVKQVSHFSDYSSQYDKITTVISILKTLQVVLYIIIGIFAFSIGIIIYSIIGNFIYYYRDEIYITRLVGGSKFFIYGPFSLQGMIYSMVSFILSLIIFLLIIKNTNFVLDGEYSSSFLIGNAPIIFTLEFLIFTFIGGISGLISSRKYLK